MKVRVKVEHHNGYGAAWTKKPNSTYEIPDEHAAPLIAAGLVVEEKAKVAAAPKPRRAPKPVAAKKVAQPKADGTGADDNKD